MKFLVVHMYAFMAILSPKEIDRGFEDDGIDKADSVGQAHRAPICFA